MRNKMNPISLAKGTLMIDHPFFGAVSCRLTMVEIPEGTACTNGKQLKINRDWFDGLTPPERIGLLAHEVMHVSHLHHTRRGGRDAKVWNMACDFAINQELQAMGFQLPAGGLVDGKFRGMGAEAIYSALMDDAQAGGGGKEPPKEQAWGQVEDGVGEDGQPVPAQEMGKVEAEAKVMLGQAMQQAKAMGKMPAELERVLVGLMKPAVNWRAVLQEFIKKTSTSGLDWNRPNRRMISQNVYLPRRKGSSLEIVVAIDTSGSIGEEDLAQFLAEVDGILTSSTKTKAWIVYCDAKINRIDEVTGEDAPLRVTPCGGGGTDFRPVFEWFPTVDGNPACLVYITDMMGSFPDEDPGFPVLWVKTTDLPAPFGEEVKISVSV